MSPTHTVVFPTPLCVPATRRTFIARLATKMSDLSAPLVTGPSHTIYTKFMHFHYTVEPNSKACLSIDPRSGDNSSTRTDSTSPIHRLSTLYGYPSLSPPPQPYSVVSIELCSVLCAMISHKSMCLSMFSART